MSEVKPIILFDLHGVGITEPFRGYTEQLTIKAFLNQVQKFGFDPVPLTSGPADRLRKLEILQMQMPILAELGSVLVESNGKEIIVQGFAKSGLESLDSIRQQNSGVNILQIANLVGQNELLVCVPIFFSWEQDARLDRIVGKRKLNFVPQNYFDEKIQNESVAVILVADQKLQVQAGVNQRTKDQGLHVSFVYPPNVSKIANALKFLESNQIQTQSFFVDNQSHNITQPTQTNLQKIGILNTGLIEYISRQIIELQQSQNQNELTQGQLKDLRIARQQWQDSDERLQTMQSNGEILLFNSRQDFIDRLAVLRSG
jgi:hypothetical protein